MVKESKETDVTGLTEDWKAIREQVQKEYEEENKDKCFVVGCNEDSVHTIPLTTTYDTVGIVSLCDQHAEWREDWYEKIDMRKFFSFGLDKS